MYNLHIYNRKIGKLQVITYEWKYINIVKSCKFFLSEFEQFATIFQCSPCILLDCVFEMAKVSLLRVGTESEEKRHGTDTWVMGSPKTMSSVICFRGKVKFSSSVSGSSTSYG